MALALLASSKRIVVPGALGALLTRTTGCERRADASASVGVTNVAGLGAGEAFCIGDGGWLVRVAYYFKGLSA